ncbi:MAG: hypothetical protein HC934_00185 [Acaryochloridaceae cyanobacterium SU_2_1]|nr:hypothetical protein [Acaryochloridaceae cyanobacterium SU_2_1]
MASHPLPEFPPDPALAAVDVRTLAPAALAYLGDAVYELYIRQQCLLPPRRSHQYHQQVVSYVRAETQAALAHQWIPHLTPAEQTIVKQGRNAATGKPKRVALETYQQATGLETLIGYLYLTNPQRLNLLLGQIIC